MRLRLPWPGRRWRLAMAPAMLVLLLLAPLPGFGADLPPLRGADWPHILDGGFNRHGEPTGFHAAGDNGYPRECGASARSCTLNRCCDPNCNARAEGTPLPDRAWTATVYLRRDCTQEWVRKEFRTTMFPTQWPESRIRATVRSAYAAGRAIRERPGQWCGCAGPMTIFGWQDGGFVRTAYPDLDRRCGCEAVPLDRR